MECFSAFFLFFLFAKKPVFCFVLCFVSSNPFHVHVPLLHHYYLLERNDCMLT